MRFSAGFETICGYNCSYNCSGYNLLVRGKSFDIVLDLNAEDRRRIVTWSPAAVHSIMS